MSDAVIKEVLEEYGGLTKAAMQPCLKTGEPAKYLYEPMIDYPNRKGAKHMRPAILMATAKAFGGRAEDVAPLAASLELLHNALLIHDDIEDGSEMRRNQKALHQDVGLEIAVNAGDALALTSLRCLTDALPRYGPSVANALNFEMHRMARETAEGQAIELGWLRDDIIDIAHEDYLVMVMKKTCWLATIYPCRAGATVAMRQGLSPDAFVRFGFFFGAAFQIADDILNIEAGADFNKEKDGDLEEGKRTLMLIDLLNRLEGVERDRLVALLEKPRGQKDAQDIHWVAEKMRSAKSIDRAKAYANGLVGAAMREFQLIFSALPDSRDKSFLEALAPWTVARKI